MSTTNDQANAEKHPCGGCGAAVGKLHQRGCDVERCADCGGQAISCACVKHTRPRLAWTGQWPGEAECIEFGWYARLVEGRGWVPCSAADDGARPDLNRFHLEAVWNADAGRFVLPQ